MRKKSLLIFVLTYIHIEISTKRYEHLKKKNRLRRHLKGASIVNFEKNEPIRQIYNCLQMFISLCCCCYGVFNCKYFKVMIKYVSLHKQYIHQIKRRITFQVFILCSFSQPVTQYTRVLEILQDSKV